MKLLYVVLIISLLTSCEKEQKNSIIGNQKEVKIDTILPLKESAKTQSSVECTDKGGDMENGFITECFFKNATLEQAYYAYIERNKDNDDGKYLEAKLPKTDFLKDGTEYPISIVYKYYEKKELTVDLLFPGGETKITFTEKAGSVNIITIHSPD